MRYLRTVRDAATATALALALAALPGPPAVADPPSPGASADELLSELRSLYRRAGAATDAYNAAVEKLTTRKARAARLHQRLAEARTALAAGRADAGRLARRQYRGAAPVLPPYLRLLTGDNPQEALRQAHLLQRLAAQRARTVDRLAAAERRLERLDQQARGARDAQRALTAEQRRQRDTVRSRIQRAERLLASMTGAERAQVRRLERTRVTRAQRALLSSGTLKNDRSPSAAGRRALAYALRQLGKPYGWGAAGPHAFDCSGLTSRAWAQAGRAIPRTSQEQWRTLPRVPLSAVRPGDLVVYYPGATHVAMYAGDGRVVHAPRPGSVVEVSPLAVNPVIGAVRPDAGG